MAGILILNPTQEAIVGRHDGASYVFKAGERKEIFNTYAARHILNRWSKFGLVDITYDDKIAKRYPVHEVYVHEKAIEGVSQQLETMLKTSVDFDTYDDECGERKTPERHMMKRKHEGHKKKIETVEKHLEELQKVDITKVVKDHVEQLNKQAEALLNQASMIEKGTDGQNTVNIKKSSKDGVTRS